VTWCNTLASLDGVPLRRERVVNDGVALHVTVAGDGHPVILLHGFPEHWWSWRFQVPVLARAGYSVWAPDLRGYNQSDRPPSIDAYNLRHLVMDVAALVRATGAPRAHVVGHDWGGIVAWTFAGYYPELIDRLVILNAPHLDIYARKVWRSTQLLRSAYVPFFATTPVAEWVLSARDFMLLRRAIRSLAVRHRAIGERDIDCYVDALRRPGALRAALAYYRANAGRDAMAWARAALIPAETLVIWAMNDPALSSVLLDGIENVAPRARIHPIRNCGHWVQAEAADEVNDVLLRFLHTTPGGTNTSDQSVSEHLNP
jgi:epoxide hydrolase 4